MNHVVLLGAGFSKAVSEVMPTLGELGPRVLAQLGPEYERALDPFGGNVEEYLSYIGADQPWLSDEANQRNRALFSETVLAIREVIVKAESEASKSLPGWLERVAWQWSRDRTAVLTFNYDTLLEEPLRLGGMAGTLADLYMVPIVERQAPGWGSMFSASGPQKPIAELFKLHGSVNWLHGGDAAPVTDPLILRYPESPGNDALPRSARIYSDLRPFIIPPTSVKNRYYDRTGLRAQWRAAGERLRGADELTIIGYSLPATDVGTTSFLRTTLNTHAVVTVVDPCPMVADRLDDLLPNALERKAGITEWLPSAVGDRIEWWVSDEGSEIARSHYQVNGVQLSDSLPQAKTRAELEEWTRRVSPDLVDIEVDVPDEGILKSRGRRLPSGRERDARLPEA